MKNVTVHSSAVQPIWTSFASSFDQPLLSADAMHAAGLAWEVEKVPNYLPGRWTEFFLPIGVDPRPLLDAGGIEVQSPPWTLDTSLHPDATVFYRATPTETTVWVLGQGQRVPSDWTLVRTDTGEILGRTVGDDYKIIQNKDAFSFLDSLAHDGIIRYEAAGTFKQGRAVWMVARIPAADFAVAGIDPVSAYLLAINTHDGRTAFQVVPTPVRVICANMIALAAQQGLGRVSLTHGGDVIAKLSDARESLSATLQTLALFSRQTERLAQTRITDEQFNEMVYRLVGVESAASHRVYEDIMDLHHTEDELSVPPSLLGTGWHALNTVTRYTTHARYSTPKTPSREIASRRMQSLVLGASHDLSTAALAAFLENLSP